MTSRFYAAASGSGTTIINNIGGSGTGFSTVTASVSQSATNVVDFFPDTTGSAAVWEYMLYSGSNARQGSVRSLWSSGSNTIEFHDFGPVDLGAVTAAVSTDIVADNVRFVVSSSTDGWTYQARRIIF